MASETAHDVRRDLLRQRAADVALLLVAAASVEERLERAEPRTDLPFGTIRQ